MSVFVCAVLLFLYILLFANFALFSRNIFNFFFVYFCFYYFLFVGCLVFVAVAGFIRPHF